MIEHSRRPLPPSLSAANLERLRERAQHQRPKHQYLSHPLYERWQQTRTTLQSPARILSRVPARFALHALIALALPTAIALSQLQSAMPNPAGVAASGSPAPAATQLVVPVAPLSLDGNLLIGDAPLDDTIPVPLSIVPRSEALAPHVVMASIAGDRVNLRGGPSTEYDSVGKMDANTPVQVIGRYGDWFQIRERVDKPTYWISGELLNINNNDVGLLNDVSKESLPALPPKKVGTVREDSLQLRDGPGTNYVPMTKLKNGTQLDLLEIYQDWYHVGVPGGSDGWVKGEFLNVDPAVNQRLDVATALPDPNPAMIGVINDNSVNVRQGPDSKYGKLGTLDVKTQVDIVGKYEDWFKIKTPKGNTAWVFSDFLNVASQVQRRVPTTSDFPKLQTPAPAAARSRQSAAASAAISIPASGDVAGFAARFAGSRYVYGGASPGGFDCSGLTMYVYRQFGVNLPHSAAAQFSSRYGAIVGSMSSLAPGDLVFFANTAGERGISHVGLYLGGGRMINAMTPYYGVQVSNIYDSYWASHYYGAVRVRR
ncbi:MAG TPA: SH3 domain-containing protein [Roseiflexaceae bacterium]|nr:SH3 domain-containing protein [Roseiflexaceae bacterium]